MSVQTQGEIKHWHKTLAQIKDNALVYKQAGANPVQMIEDIEFILQMLWGFSLDANFHTHWIDIRGCTCPRMDNMERIGFGRVISSDCPWHGNNERDYESND